MYDFDVDLSPPAAIIAANFAAYGLDIRSFREPLKRSIQQVLAPSFRRNFVEGGRPEQWDELSDITLARKAALGQDLSPLVATRTLMRVAGQLNIWHLTSEEAYVDQLPNAEYGRFHMTGTEFMPSRPFLVIQPEDEEEIEEVFVQWLFQRAMAKGVIDTIGGLIAEVTSAGD